MKRLLLLVVLAIVALLCLAHFNRASSRNDFLGDSITYQWPFPRANDGIYGQTSAQILAREPAALGAHGYRKIYILAGTNDVLLGIDADVTARNLETMIAVAQRNGVQPVLALLPPIFEENGRFLPAVRVTNDRIRQIAAEHQLPLIDYYGALEHHPTELVGGLHMKRRSYLRMEWALARTSNPF